MAKLSNLVKESSETEVFYQEDEYASWVRQIYSKEHAGQDAVPRKKDDDARYGSVQDMRAAPSVDVLESFEGLRILRFAGSTQCGRGSLWKRATKHRAAQQAPQREPMRSPDLLNSLAAQVLRIRRGSRPPGASSLGLKMVLTGPATGKQGRREWRAGSEGKVSRQDQFGSS